MKKRLLLCAAIAMVAAVNVCAQNWKMVVKRADGTKGLHMHVYSSTIHNCKNMEAA